ncbi:hypothetical protein [Dialister sp.]|uniref:hypothetical protein n=1 Tax=Dialister sp. TaxID=1955814 RepID=UPI003F0A761F
METPILLEDQCFLQEALMQSLPDFIPDFSCNAGNGTAQTARFHNAAVHKNFYESSLYE